MNDNLKTALEGEDDLGVVIRSHIIVEQYLNQLIESMMVDISSYRSVEIDYHSKVKLAVALGLNKRFAPFLNSLGTLRNDFAHKLRPEIKKQDANNLYKCLHETDKKILETSLIKTTKELGNQVPKLNQCTPKQKYIYCVTTMCATLHYACSKLPNKQRQRTFAAPLL
jgi:hypothetical protein